MKNWSKVEKMVGMPDFAVGFTLSPWPDGGWMASITLTNKWYAEDQGLLATKLQEDRQGNWNMVDGFRDGLTARGSNADKAIENLYKLLIKL